MDFESHLKRQMAFSRATFGPGERREGVTDHIRQEIDEVLADGGPQEWVDLVLLSMDGLWRSLYYSKQYDWATIAEISAKLIERKQSKNEQRDWPDWRTADPNKAINHDRTKD